MNDTLYESRQKNLPPVIIAGYFILFGVIYFTGFDAAPSTSYFWRFCLLVIAMVSLNKWRNYWPMIGLVILFLMLIEFVITMTATYDFFNTPENVGIGTFLLWHQDVWFFIHILAMCVWYWGKPQNDLYRWHQNSDKIRT